MPTAPPLAKLTRPSAAGLLRRERLFALLDCARAARCVWLCAPAGSGKTSLVASWIETRALPCCWYQADAGDADPASFFHYLGLAGKAAAGRRRVELPHLTPEYLPGIEVFVRRFFERFFGCFKAPAVLVIDNYQEVAPGSPFHAIVAGALEALPASGQLVCVSREEAPQALARWRAQPGFQSVGWDELRLTDAEAGALARLDEGSEGDGEGDAIRMNARARGWAAGLKLLLQAQAAGIELAATEETAPQALFDYFAAEVFERARPALREFLLKTSLLPSLTAELARQISAEEQAEKMLAWLHRNRLFTDRRLKPRAQAFYEYHPLFREFLLERARQEIAPAALSELRARAAALLEAAGGADHAAALWIEAHDWPALARLVCQQGPAMLAQGRIATLEEWIVSIPASWRDSAPWLLYWLGTCQSFRDPVMGRRSLEPAYAKFKAAGEMTGAFLVLAGILSGFFYQWGDMKPLDPWIAEFEQLLASNGGVMPPAAEVQVLGSGVAVMFRRPDHPLLAGLVQRATSLIGTLPDANQRLLLSGFVIIALTWWGELSQARAICEELLRAAQHQAAAWVRVFSGGWMGCLMWQEAEHETASAVLETALDLGRESGIHLLDPMLHLHLAYTALSVGDADTAERALDAGGAWLNPSRQIDIVHYRYMHAGALLVRGRFKEAIAIAQANLPPAIGLSSPFGEATFRIQLGQMLILDGQHPQAREHLEKALAFAERMPSTILEFQALMALAYSHLATADDDVGMDHLRRALAIGARQNYMNCHPWWIPSVMSQLCARALAADIEADYVRRLIVKRRLVPPAEGLDLEGWPWAVRIYSLGRFAIVIDGAPLRFAAKAQKKPLDLLKALIALGSRGVSAGALAGSLWPELEGDAAHNALHVALHRLRRLLGNDDALVLQEGRLSLDPRDAWVDAWAFERLAGSAETPARRPAEEDPEAAQETASRLLRLYLGHFLGEEEAPWAIAHRERLRSKLVRALAALGARLEQARRFEPAAELYRKVLELDPLAEAFHCALMRCLKHQGRAAEALGAYRRCRHILSVTLGVQPSAEAQALYRELKP